MAVSTHRKKYHELAEHLRERIMRGELKVGQRLPSYTELYDEHGASTATIQRACDLLDQERLIERRHGSGIYVAAPQRDLSGTVGIIGSPGFNRPENPFYVSLMNAVHEALEADQRHMLYLGMRDSWDSSVARKVDGVLFCGQDEAASLSKLPAHLPRVAMLTKVEGVTSVGVDNFEGAQIGVRHLLRCGHTRIGCLMEKGAWEARRRVAGYDDALQEAGIEGGPGWKRVVQGVGDNAPDQHSYLDWAREHMTAWLHEGWRETGCTAILVQNDLAAIGVTQALQKAGIRVPDDVSVMGFDGTAICDLIAPRLSAVALPLAQIGARAVELLARQIAGEEMAPEAIMLPWSLRIGESIRRIS